MMDMSLRAAGAGVEDPQTWLPPEAPLDMPRQGLEAEGGRRPLLAPLLHLMMFRSRA